MQVKTGTVHRATCTESDSALVGATPPRLERRDREGRSLKLLSPDLSFLTRVGMRWPEAAETGDTSIPACSNGATHW